MERRRTEEVKEQIEEELKKLEDEINVSSSSSGFDRHTSLVFNPTNPENSVEDCLAVLGDQVVIELDTHLTTAVDALLTGLVHSVFLVERRREELDSLRSNFTLTLSSL
uniref:Uncharacterized protein n=1 Tax=Neogobius melanostomus TaxID=47308 RepID=A0A8C6SE07_9GOBI